ncbi:hypothetical protein [Sulfoacidibacillus thermotolerans]|uniref:Uncharacterized protein n=1 Tax=Sulfoacidibacillus thermotolerans TaxID=1765684 RepID=A0A2U3D5Z4_SULT2|nr:hypothetical protein [Sulfoacidibacillus thermotolerans]PWI56689.1 hypothetical protein BM613_12470 [Sulfoacidibacillus thermotolerans]
MDIVHTPHELMERIEKLDKDHSVCQVFIPGKGQVTIVLQANDNDTIASEVQADPQLGELIQSSRNAYQRGDAMTTSELLKSLSSKDFAQ